MRPIKKASVEFRMLWVWLVINHSLPNKRERVVFGTKASAKLLRPCTVCDQDTGKHHFI